MAINKKLIHFNKKVTFDNELSAGNILDTSIVFIKDANLIWTHGNYYGLSDDEVIISDGIEPTDDQEIWIDLSESSTASVVEEASADGSAYVRKNKSWVSTQVNEVVIRTTEPTEDCDLWINPDDDSVKYNKNGTWVEISGGTSVVTETAKITLTSNQTNPNPDLNNLVVSVTYSGITKELTWVGSELSINIPFGVDYTISSPAVSGYATPEDQTFTAVMGETRNISVIYNTTVVTVNKACNQSESLTCTATVAYGEVSTVLSFDSTDTNKTINIPTGESYTITFSDVDNYKTPDVISQTASGANQSVTGTYQAELVSITVTTSDGSSATGQVITITVDGTETDYTWSDSTISVKVPFEKTYTISVDAKSSYITPTSQSYTAEQVSRSITFNYVYSPIIGTTFKDSDGSVTLTQNTGIDTSWIIGKRCLVKKTSSGVAICYLDGNNSELFHDGTTTAKLDGTMGQWMTDIPEYYFNVDESTSGTHVLQVSKNQKNGYKQSRRVLLGVTEAVNVGSKLWSKKGGQSTGDLTPIVFHNYATALGDGFDIIDYESHCKIAHLFCTKYANRNPQTMTLFGYGEDSYTRTIGTTSSLGNADGKTSTQISFLGIEDFYGGKYEWMGGIHSNGSVYYIYDGFTPDAVPTGNYRTVDVGGSNRYGYISKLQWGEYGDIIPTEFNGSSTTHYCDYGYVARSSWRVAERSASSADSYGGVFVFDAPFSSGSSYARCGSRIQYRGNIQIIEDPAEFIALAIGF